MEDYRSMKVHSMPTEWGYQTIVYQIPLILLCVFTIKISEHIDLWLQVLETINVSWIMIAVAWTMLIISIVYIAIGITVILFRDKSNKDD